MRRSLIISRLRFTAGFLVAALLVTCRPDDRAANRAAYTPSPDSVDDDIRQLATPGGKVKTSAFLRADLLFEFSPPMERLATRGSAVQPRLLAALSDSQVRCEAVIVLGRIGDADAIPHLIDLLPAVTDISEEEKFTTKCVLDVLWQLTGIRPNYHRLRTPEYSSEVRDQWLAWFAANKDYLYSPPASTPIGLVPARGQVLLDLEAKIAGTTSSAYRRDHPWITFAEISTWRDHPAYERCLRDYCFSVLLNPKTSAHGHLPRAATWALGLLRDPKALAALHALCAMAADVDQTNELLIALGVRGDPSSLPVIARIPAAKDGGHYEVRRKYEFERIRLLEKFGRQLAGKPFDLDQRTDFARCMDDDRGVQSLVESLGDPKLDVFLPKYMLVAGYVDKPAVRDSLREIASDATRDDRAKVMAHGALARLGEPGSLDKLLGALSSDSTGVRLAAAEGLWRLGRRDGVQTLVDLLDLRPLETGTEGVRVGGDAIITVTAIRGGNVDIVRAACSLLGEIGDRSAIEPLKRLLLLNLNGISADGGSGTGWSGRPDAVALAKLGDDSGVEVLRASIAKGDPLGVVGGWGGGDFVAIGQRRFIPELLPLLRHPNDEKRVAAAQDILLLLERGR
jgi:HEAT repeat protein